VFGPFGGVTRSSSGHRPGQEVWQTVGVNSRASTQAPQRTPVSDPPRDAADEAPHTVAARRSSLLDRQRERVRRSPETSVVIGALGIWCLSRLAVAIITVVGMWAPHRYTRAQVPGFFDQWRGWDTTWFVDIAQHGYFRPGFENAQYQCCTHAFFPGEPLALRAMHLLVPHWIPAGLLLSAVAGAFGVVALARMAYAESPPDEVVERRVEASRRAVLYLVLAPYALFLFAVYSEALFLAFALLGWLAARNGRWRSAGLLVAAASFVRITGLFLAAGLAVEYVVSRRRAGLPVIAWPAGWLLAPAVSVGGYFLYLYARTGDLLAWQHAQSRPLGWGRTFRDPLTSLKITYGVVADRFQLADYAFARRAEIVAMVIGGLLTLVLAYRRRWGEMVYVGLSVVALGTDGIYFATGRAMLLWFPLWLLLAQAAMRRQWLHGLLVWCSAPVMAILVFAYNSGFWVN